MKTYWLSTHLGYACRHSGACCSSRWPIPIERDRAAEVSKAVDAGLVSPMVTPWLRPDPAAPGDVAGILAHQPAGACVFHGRSGCGIYSARPRSCEHFPYLPVVDARGVHVTLSHYCPTAAEMLFLPGAPEVVEGPPVFVDGRVPEGLDAEESLPPTRMEADCTDAGAADDTDAGAADDTDAGAADDTDVRAADGADGRAADGADGRAADGADGTDGTEGRCLRGERSALRAGRPCRRTGVQGRDTGACTRAPRLMDWAEVTRWEQQAVRAVASETRMPDPPRLALFEHARAAVASPLAWPPAPEGLDAAWAERVAPYWRAWSAVVGRYLATKVHASWAMFLGSGPVDVMRSVDVARAVLQVEATRQCARAGHPLDRMLLKEAIRQSDLLLVHYADPYDLARF